MPDSSSSDDTRPDPTERGRLGFSRTALSLVGLLVMLGFLIWFFVFV